MCSLAENCPFDQSTEEEENVSPFNTNLECLPYESFRDIHRFFQLEAKDRLYPWLQNIRELCRVSDTCTAGEQLDLVSSITRKRMLRNSVPKTLICHDYKGGYLEDRFVEGSIKHESYKFFHWSAVDVFVYFSHYFLTVPPPSWINSGHLHGVPVLGTLITEWNEQEADKWEIILQSRAISKWFADAFAHIAKLHKFDGYLLNIETPIDQTLVLELIVFLKLLKSALNYELGPNNYLIWYDSVTIEGELKWQNELNKRNYNYFDICDGIFVNYSWKEENLATSVSVAKERHLDVYVGVDVFGRTPVPRGGFNTSKALEIIKNYNLSIAFFAVGWTHEVLPGNFDVNDILFWKELSKYLYIHGPVELPFKTSFCRGYGLKYYKNGDVYCNTTWYDLGKQCYQPTNINLFCQQNYQRIIDNIDVVLRLPSEERRGQELELELAQKSFVEDVEFYVLDAFNGGGCLKIDTNNKQMSCSLYTCSFDVDSDILFSMVVKSFSDECVIDHTGSSRWPFIYVVFETSSTRMKKINLVQEQDGAEEMSPDIVSYQVRHYENGWCSRTFRLVERGTIVDIGIEVPPHTPASLLGEISITAV